MFGVDLYGRVRLAVLGQGLSQPGFLVWVRPPGEKKIVNSDILYYLLIYPFKLPFGVLRLKWRLTLGTTILMKHEPRAASKLGRQADAGAQENQTDEPRVVPRVVNNKG